MSRHVPELIDTDDSAASDMAEPLQQQEAADVVQRLVHVFTQLQETRLAAMSAPLTNAAADEDGSVVPPAEAPRPAFWCGQVAQALGEHVRHVPWLGLCQAVLGAEDLPSNTNGSRLFVQWFAGTNFDEQIIEESLAELADNAAEAITIKDVTGHVLVALAAVGSGRLMEAGTLLSALSDAIRFDAAFTAEEETCLSAVLALLAQPFPDDPHAFLVWRKRAKEVAKDARFDLVPARSGNPVDAKDAFVRAIRDFLFGITGDAAAYLQNAALRQNPLVGVAGVFAVIEPFLSLADAKAVAIALLKAAGDRCPGEDQLALRIFGAATPLELVGIFSADTTVPPCDDLAPETAAVVWLGAVAHVADLCAPPFAAADERQWAAVLARNALVVRYVDAAEAVLPLGCRVHIRVPYAAWSPLADPEPTLAALTAAIEAPSLRSDALSLLQRYLCHTSAHQVRLRAATTQLAGNAAVLAPLYAAWDAHVEALRADAAALTSNAAADAGDMVTLIVTAARTSDYAALCSILAATVGSDVALDNGLLHAVGGAVSTGVVRLGWITHAATLHYVVAAHGLYLCAAAPAPAGSPAWAQQVVGGLTAVCSSGVEARLHNNTRRRLLELALRVLERAHAGPHAAAQIFDGRRAASDFVAITQRLWGSVAVRSPSPSRCDAGDVQRLLELTTCLC